jgi:type III pantothenate kinase
MLITIDVGNTHICLGLYAQDRLVKEFRLSTNRNATADEMGLVISGLLSGVNASLTWEGAVLASVVPELDSVIAKAVFDAFNIKVLKISPDMPLPIKNQYRPTHVVGADRLMNAVAAVEEFGAPVMVVDFGTAITVDVVSKQKVYLGGAILPGLSLAADALAQNTSLLHRVELRAPRMALGRDTEESLRAGVLLGAAGAVSLIVKRIRKEMGSPVKVIATGGMASLVVAHCTEIKEIRPHLTLDGLKLSWEYCKHRRLR